MRELWVAFVGLTAVSLLMLGPFAIGYCVQHALADMLTYSKRWTVAVSAFWAVVAFADALVGAYALLYRVALPALGI